jgi:hypothetical protein
VGERFARSYPTDRDLLVALIQGVNEHVGKRIRPGLADVLHHGRGVRVAICAVAKADPFGRADDEGVS